VQRKLAVANCTLCETVECRDSRIQELETMLCCKQQEVLSILCTNTGILTSHRKIIISSNWIEVSHLFVRRSIVQKQGLISVFEIGVAGARGATAITKYGASNGFQRKSCTEVRIRDKTYVWYAFPSLVPALHLDV
jgi:hypothetical protein